MRGTVDHVHLLVGLRATHRLADVLREIKSASSEWVHKEMGVRLFSWQEGYGAFSIGLSRMDATVSYIKNQAEHHRTRSVREEFKAMLRKHGLDYDERILD